MDKRLIDELPLGAHLVTPRRFYRHHGIYAGGGRVIHYRGFKTLFERGPVEEITLEAFAQGGQVLVKSLPADPFAGAARVERARSRLGEDRYRLLSNNCWHFVKWCVSATPSLT
jgi:lecithin:retinol acyltransferase